MQAPDGLALNSSCRKMGKRKERKWRCPLSRIMLFLDNGFLTPGRARRE